MKILNMSVWKNFATDLDPISKQGIFDITNQLRKREDMTLIVVEHETEEVLNADRIALIKDGKLMRVGAAREILNQVALMEELGVMPLEIPGFFKKMDYNPLPLTPDEGVQTFHEAGWVISEDKYAQLLEKEKLTAQHDDQPIIQCRNLEHTYPNGVKALNGIDLDIFEGEMVAIVGQNGSGKTTLVKHLNGLLEPTNGSVKINGLHTKEQGVFKIGQKVGYVF